MSTENNEIVKSEKQEVVSNGIPTQASFTDSASFEHAQRVAKMLCSSNLIPEQYRGNLQNTMIALELANRIGASPLQVMQNLYVIQGKPSWSSSFIIAALNSCKRFSPLRFEMTGEGDEYGCQAWAYDTATKDKLLGPKITWSMVKAEGWFTKSGSKWKTMSELMFRYRAAAFFGRLYAPDILMGMHSADELEDVCSYPEPTEEVKQVTHDLAEKLKAKKEKSTELFTPETETK